MSDSHYNGEGEDRSPFPKARKLTPADRVAALPPTDTIRAEQPHSPEKPPHSRVLVIEDNEKVAGAIAHGLRAQGFAVEVSPTGSRGEAEAASGAFNAVVLDLMLPDRDGLDVCRDLRRRGVRTPILILSAISGTSDKVQGLNAGADDYLTKPFELEELVARVKALLRRHEQIDATQLRVGDIELDLTRRVARRHGEAVPLTNKEFALLEFFMRRPEQVLTRTQIGEGVWDVNFDPASNVIDVYVSMLRKKVDRGFDKPMIHTVVGSGYMFGERAD